MSIANMRIAVISSYTPSLLNFRIDMMREFVSKGHSVMAVGHEPEERWRKMFADNNIEYRQIRVSRNGLNPFADMRLLYDLVRLFRAAKSNVVFAYNPKTVIYGSIAAKLCGITDIYLLIAGLGSVIRGASAKLRFVSLIMRPLYGIACWCSKKVFFHNDDDRSVFVASKLVEPDKAVVINGSGVDVDRYMLAPMPESPAFLFVGRLIKDKGIVEYLEACRLIKLMHPGVRCLLVGPLDSNPSALTQSALRTYVDAGVVEYFGEQLDVRPFIAECSALVLPSYHEGTPKVVLEAMAMGRPVITSNAPGCRSTVTHEVNGFLVEVKDIQGIVACMQRLIENPRLGGTMGAFGRKIAEDKYDVRKVNHSILKEMELL